MLYPTIKRVQKTRIGKVVTEGHRLSFFAGYSECGNCGTRCKILMDIDEAREFSKVFGVHSREPIGAKVAKRLMKHYEL